MDFCSKCGEPLVPGTKFCGKCGALMTSQPAIAPQPPPVMPSGLSATSGDEMPANPVTITSRGTVATTVYPPMDTGETIISTSRPSRLNFGEKLFTVVVVVLFAAVVAGVATSGVALISSFTGDPFHVVPLLKGWGVDLWDESSATSAPLPTTANSASLSSQTTVTTKPVTVDPVPTPQIQSRRTSIVIETRGPGAKDTARSQNQIFAALKKNMDRITQIWDKVLTANPTWPASEMKVTTQVNANGIAKDTRMAANDRVPKAVSDEVVKVVAGTSYGRAANSVNLTITFKFTPPK